MELFEHNRKAYEALKEALVHDQCTCVIHPTGTGKAYIALQLIEDNPDARILYVTSYAANLVDFYQKAKKVHDRVEINVSNIKHYKSEDAADGIKDENLDELIELSRGTSDGTGSEADGGAEDAGEENSALTGTMPCVQLSLYAGLTQDFLNLDYILLDEMHHAGAPIWEGRVRKVMGDNPEAKVVGFTATPIRYNDNNRDMREEMFGGNVASEITLADALARKILPLPHYYTATYSFDDEFERIAKKRFADDEKKLRLIEQAKRKLENAGGLDEFLAETMDTNGKYIVFCANINHLHTMMKADFWPDFKKFEMHSEDRSGLKAFNGSSSGLLFVVDMLNEGVHSEDIDGIVMLRSTDSVTVYLQQLGRALSVYTKVDHPVIIDVVNNVNVLRPIKSFWELVGEQFRENGEPFDEYFEVSRRDIIFEEFLKEVEALPKLTWDEYCDRCEDYYNENGNLLMEPGYTVDGYNLHSWCIRQRFHKDSLSEYQVDRLNAIGFIWDPKEYMDIKWYRNYGVAKIYREEFGDLKPRVKVRFYHGVWIYDWLMRNIGQKDKLSDEQVRLLDELGIDWTITKRKQNRWPDYYPKLVEFFEENGHLNIPKNYVTDDGIDLGGAISRLRAAHRKGTLPAEKIQALEELGIIWEGNQARGAISWDVGMAHAREYHKENGHINAPDGYVCDDGYNLSIFIKNIRRKAKQGKLSDEQRSELESMGLKFEVVTGILTWEEKVGLFTKYKEEHGDMRIPSTYVTDGVPLGRLFTDIKVAWRRGELPEERVRELEALGASNEKADQLRDTLKRFDEYYEEHGELDFSSKSPLYSTVLTARAAYRKGKLSEEQVQHLKGMGFVFESRNGDRYDTIAALLKEKEETGEFDRDKSNYTRSLYKKGKISEDWIEKLKNAGFSFDPLRDQWLKGLGEAKVYYEENGNLEVRNDYTHNGYRLGTWISNQRSKRKRGALTDEQIAMLDEIGMRWQNLR